MKISAKFIPENYTQFLASVQAAERYGFAKVYVLDGQLLWRDMYVYMTRALDVTTTIPIGSAVTNPVTRHVTVTANAHATLAEIHPGRVILGIGRGDNAVRTIGGAPISTAALRDATAQLRALTAGDQVELGGIALQSKWRPQERIPILMAATRPASLRVAGSMADIVMIQVGLNPLSCRWAIDRVVEGAISAGRDPDSLQIVAYSAICISEDRQEARRSTQWATDLIGQNLSILARMNRLEELPEPLVRLAKLRRADYGYNGHLDPAADHGSYPEDVVDDYSLNGPPELIADRLSELARQGVDEVALAYMNGREADMEVIASKIMPVVEKVRPDRSTRN
jgi:alkanesulfonate monooxygenase SsuD/methylene tetrahydromethanopterin reductase-like flavin-dependent oxidoreductase (luciferase family)